MWSENSPMSPLCLRSVCFILSERPTLYRMPFLTCHSHQHDMYLNATETSSPLLYVLASLRPDQGCDVHSPDSHGTMQHLTYEDPQCHPSSSGSVQAASINHDESCELRASPNSLCIL